MGGYRIFTNGPRVGHRLKKSIIVFGPSGSGKTRNLELIKNFFGFENAQDGVSLKDWEFKRKGHVILTNDVPDPKLLDRYRISAYSVDQLKKLLPNWI